jgi:cell division septation protein DedD
MARSSTGKSVARAAATGGGTTYRGQMPVNWYAALVIIVVVGIASVAFARYNYAKGGPPPTTSQTWHAGLAIDVCGTMEPSLATSTASSTNGLVMASGGVMVVHPATSSESGNNATLGKFSSEYEGLKLTDDSLQLPTKGSHAYSNGQTCPKGTPDAGKKGEVRARTWLISTSAGKDGTLKQVGGDYASSPTGLKLLDRQLITLGFGPTSVALPKPSASTVKALELALEGAQAPVTTTTAPATTTTTVPATTTTAPATTTTAKPSTTTTTKPK